MLVRWFISTCLKSSIHPNWCKISFQQFSTLLLMAEILHQLRLVGYPIIYGVFYIPGGCLGFLPSTLWRHVVLKKSIGSVKRTCVEKKIQESKTLSPFPKYQTDTITIYSNYVYCTYTYVNIYIYVSYMIIYRVHTVNIYIYITIYYIYTYIYTYIYIYYIWTIKGWFKISQESPQPFRVPFNPLRLLTALTGGAESLAAFWGDRSWSCASITWKTRTYMGVSENNGTPKSSILIGFSIINHPFWGTPPLIFGNTHYSKN